PLAGAPQRARAGLSGWAGTTPTRGSTSSGATCPAHKRATASPRHRSGEPPWEDQTRCQVRWHRSASPSPCRVVLEGRRLRLAPYCWQQPAPLPLRPGSGWPATHHSSVPEQHSASLPSSASTLGGPLAVGHTYPTPLRPETP